MVLGKLPVPGRPTKWMIVGQGLIALAVGAGGDCLDIFTILYLFSSLSPSFWETARYRLKYCLKGPLKPNQPTKNLSRDQHGVCVKTHSMSTTKGGNIKRSCTTFNTYVFLRRKFRFKLEVGRGGVDYQMLIS